MRESRRVAVIAGAAVIVASACGGGRPTVKAPARVALFGDSILQDSAFDVAAALQHAGWTDQIDAHGGSAITGGPSVPSWPSEMRARLASAPVDVAVVELGTNDCVCRRIADGIDAVMAALQHVPRVYWINVREGAPTPDDARAIDAALQQATHRWSNLHVIDMNRRLRGKPQLIAPDRVHLSAAGSAVFANMIVSALPRVVHA